MHCEICGILLKNTLVDEYGNSKDIYCEKCSKLPIFKDNNMDNKI